LQVGVFGAVMKTDCTKLSYLGELFGVLAGPLGNLLLAVALGHICPERTDWIGVNLALCLFNLLPIRPLDGGRALQLILYCFFDPAAGEKICRIMDAAGAVVFLAVLAKIMEGSGGSLWLLLPACNFLGIFWENISRKRAKKQLLFKNNACN